MIAITKLDETLKDILFQGLREKEVQIEFIKKDGQQRAMKCTLNHSLIPQEHAPKGTNTVVEDEEEPSFIRVFDTEVKGWRTIILDSIRKFGNP